MDWAVTCGMGSREVWAGVHLILTQVTSNHQFQRLLFREANSFLQVTPTGSGGIQTSSANTHIPGISVSFPSTSSGLPLPPLPLSLEGAAYRPTVHLQGQGDLGADPNCSGWLPGHERGMRHSQGSVLLGPESGAPRESPYPSHRQTVTPQRGHTQVGGSAGCTLT